jgi:MFS family permease
MFGALSCIKLGDMLGRIRTIGIGCALTVIGSVILCNNISLAQLIVGRLVLGLGFGAVTATVPVWQAESSPTENRGALVVLEGAFASAGLALSQLIDLGLFFTGSSVFVVPLSTCVPHCSGAFNTRCSSIPTRFAAVAR